MTKKEINLAMDHEAVVRFKMQRDQFIRLAEEVAKEYPDAADWKDAIGKLQGMARAALCNL